MTEPKSRFKVAEIAIDEDGVLWLYYGGQHPDQGGLSYRWGSVGLHSAKDLGSYVQRTIERELPEYLEQIKKKMIAKRKLLIP